MYVVLLCVAVMRVGAADEEAPDEEAAGADVGVPDEAAAEGVAAVL